MQNDLSEEAGAVPEEAIDSTMTNSDTHSPKKDEKNHDYSFSAASDDEVSFDNIEVNAALNDLKGPSRSEVTIQEDEDLIGKRLIDRKRLRIFANITKKKENVLGDSND